MKLEPQLPGGAIQDAWTQRRRELPLISPINKRRFKVLVVGSGLAGASAAATLA